MMQVTKLVAIHISARGISNLIEKWVKTKFVADIPRKNKCKSLIKCGVIFAINKVLLKNPFLTATKIKIELVLTASTRTINRYIGMLGWRKLNTKYCQIVSPVNRLKRFNYCCMCKIHNEQYDDVIYIDECTVELKTTTYKTGINNLLNYLERMEGKSANLNIIKKDCHPWSCLNESCTVKTSRMF